MCKARPGMRCSNHAKTKIKDSQKALKKVVLNKDSSQSERELAAERLRNARIEYYTTTEGQEKLEEILSGDFDPDKQETAIFYLREAQERKKYETMQQLG